MVGRHQLVLVVISRKWVLNETRLRLIVHSSVRKLSWPYTVSVRKLSWPYTVSVRKLSWPYTASVIICSRKAVTAAVEAAAAISAEPLKGSAAMCSRKHWVYGQESFRTLSLRLSTPVKKTPCNNSDILMFCKISLSLFCFLGLSDEEGIIPPIDWGLSTGLWLICW